MKNMYIIFYTLFLLTACNGSDGGGAATPAYIGTFEGECITNGSDSTKGTRVFTATTMDYTELEFVGNTTCSGVGVDVPMGGPIEYTIVESSSNTFMIQTVHGQGMIKAIDGAIVYDVYPNATFSSDWDYVTEGSYLIYTRR